MYCSLVSVLALSGVLALPTDNPRPAAPAYPQEGSDIPGPFSPYNISGRKKDHFHCLVCEHGLNPVVMVVVRLGSRVVGASWTQATGIRHAAIAIPFLVLALVLTFVLTQQFIAAGDDPSKGPGPGLFTALSHTYFVGLLTNILFATILAAGSSRIWPWADHVIFWGLNIGAASFIAVLLTVGSSAGFGPFSHPVAFTAPIMGLSVLLAIVTYQLRLGSAPAPIRATAPA